VYNYSEKYTQKVDKTQEVYLSSYRKKRQIMAVLDKFSDKEFAKECGINHTHFLEVFGSGKRYQNLKKRLSDCGSYLTFRWYHKKDETKLHHANFCKADKLCPACAVRRAYKQQKKFLQAWNVKKELQSKKWYYIVIPVPHTIDDDIEVVYQKVEKVRKSIVQAVRDSKKGKKAGIWGLFDGGMGSVEVTKTRNGWNVHLNLIVSSDHDIDIKPIKNRRGQISCQNPQIFEFLERQVGGKMHNITRIDTSSEDFLKSNLVEVLKYALKFSSLNTMDLIEVYMKFYRKKLFFSFGSLWGLKLDDVELDGDEVVDDEFIEVIYRRVSGYYEKVEEREKKVEHIKRSSNIEKKSISLKCKKRYAKPIQIIELDRFGIIKRKYFDYSVNNYVFWPKKSLDTGAPLAHLLPSRYERSKCFGRGGAKPLLYASKMWLAALSFKKAPFPRPRPSKRKRSSCERLSRLRKHLSWS